MLFSRWEATERVGNFLSRQPHRVHDLHPFDQIGEHGTAGQRRRAAVSEKAGSFDATITNPQTQTQTITADGVRLLRYRVRIREFTGVARVRKMIFEGF